MKIIIILIIIINFSCYDDSENKDYHTINTPNFQSTEEINKHCQHGKMSCTENKAVLCWEEEYILIDDCNLSDKICYFNQPELSNGIPFYAICY